MIGRSAATVSSKGRIGAGQHPATGELGKETFHRTVQIDHSVIHQ